MHSQNTTIRVAQIASCQSRACQVPPRLLQETRSVSAKRQAVNEIEDDIDSTSSSPLSLPRAKGIHARGPETHMLTKLSHLTYPLITNPLQSSRNHSSYVDPAQNLLKCPLLPTSRLCRPLTRITLCWRILGRRKSLIFDISLFWLFAFLCF